TRRGSVRPPGPVELARVRRLLWVVFLLAGTVAIATVAVPTLYIQPFKPQAAEGLARAYALRQAAPAVTAVCLPLVLVSAAALVWLGALRPKRRTEVPSRVGQDFSPARQRSTEVPRHIAPESQVGQDFS